MCWEERPIYDWQLMVDHDTPTLPHVKPATQPGLEKKYSQYRGSRLPLTLPDASLYLRAWSSPGWEVAFLYRVIASQSSTQQVGDLLSKIDESMDALVWSKFSCNLDLRSGYWQAPLNLDTRENTALMTRAGLWQWQLLPSGLLLAPAAFQRLMEGLFRGSHWHTPPLYRQYNHNWVGLLHPSEATGLSFTKNESCWDKAKIVKVHANSCRKKFTIWVTWSAGMKWLCCRFLTRMCQLENMRSIDNYFSL